ncbi:MAG: carbohydrate-binding protein [Opitutaceae bacterium]|nr:carbohydrate-binding protein [Opitutaceae bacterium]
MSTPLSLRVLVRPAHLVFAFALCLAAARLSAAAGTTYGNGGALWDPHSQRVTIEAENFDADGEGAAYHDHDGRRAGATLRPTEGVDLGAFTTVTESGVMVNSIVAGEWLRYSARVLTTARFRLRLRVANSGAAIANAITVSWKDAPLGSALTVPTTGGSTEFAEVVLDEVILTVGPDALKVSFAAGGFNFDAIIVEQLGPLHYADWIQEYFPGGPPEQISRDADPDGDGLNNLMEYALLLPPNFPYTRSFGGVWTDPGTGTQYLAIGYTVGNDAHIVAEISTDLVNWSSGQADIIGYGFLKHTIDGLYTSGTKRSTIPLGQQPRQFVRLRVTLPP